MTMNIHSIIQYLDEKVPPMLQESYDNSGFLIGNKTNALTNVLITLDVTEQVVAEAVEKGCNLIVAHHPLIFKGLKKLTFQDEVSCTVASAIKNDIAIYAAHTNLDSVDFGVSKKLCEKIGLTDCQVLQPKTDLLRKLVTFVPSDYKDQVANAVFQAGAGHIGHYDECGYTSQGKGTFRAGAHTNPFVGKKHQRHTEPEDRFETIFPVFRQSHVVRALKESHPYEEVAFDIYPLDLPYEKVGLGMVGSLPQETETSEFLFSLKEKLQLKSLRHTPILKPTVKKVAVCGGTGSSLITIVKKHRADIFITADVKYHEFFEAGKEMVIADIGHYESEKYAKELLYQLIIEKFSNFAPALSEVVTNPVNYL